MSKTHAATAVVSAPDACADEDLKRLAEVVLVVGMNLQPGQELIVTAPLEAAPLIRHVTENAYRRRARLVTCLYEDPDMLRVRLVHAGEETLDHAPTWLSESVARALEDGAARLSILGPRPELLTDVSPHRLGRVHASLHRAAAPERRIVSAARPHCSTVPFATVGWATNLLPDLKPGEAMQRLWRSILAATRADAPDPLRAWKEHIAALDARISALQARKFSALSFHDGRTDLTVQLLEGHVWAGGSVRASNGVVHVPAIPAEEVFTSVRSDSAHGTVFLSRPLVLAGTRVEDVRITLNEGAVTTISAAKGQHALEHLLSLDPGACRLGELGLVAASSPISRLDVLQAPALDRHAATRIAFGEPSALCLPATGPRPPGSNRSSVHIDCIIGTPAMRVDGIDAAGTITPIMRGGEFAIS